MPPEKDYAIVIGINGYSKLPELSAAQTDAADFIQWLIDGAGLSPSDIKEVKSPAEGWLANGGPLQAKPVQADIIEKLQEMGIGIDDNPPAKIGRRLYFYFAGHGFGPTPLEVGMLMANASDKGYMNSLGLEPCRRFFRKYHLFDEVIFILDCCRDAKGYETVMTQGFEPLLAAFPGTIAPIEDFMILATTFGEKALAPFDDKVQKRRGLLTAALLEGLKGEPRAADARGNVTVSSLSNYVRTRVRELAEDLKTAEEKKQEAEIPYLPNKEIIFAKVAKQIQVRIVAPNGLDGDLVVYNGAGDIIEQRAAASAIRAQVPWVVSLLKTAVPYSVKHSTTEMEMLLPLGKVEGDNHEFRFPSPQ